MRSGASVTLRITCVRSWRSADRPVEVVDHQHDGRVLADGVKQAADRLEQTEAFVLRAAALHAGQLGETTAMVGTSSARSGPCAPSCRRISSTGVDSM